MKERPADFEQNTLLALSFQKNFLEKSIAVEDEKALLGGREGLLFLSLQMPC